MAPTRIRRTLEVDTLRGLACILLVSFHVVGSSAGSGLQLPPGHWLQQLNDAVGYLRMPLFSFLSGYVYGMRPLRGDATEFMKAKVRRLLLPLLTVGTLFALVQSRTHGANEHVMNWWLLHIVPVGHFWFLEALFIVFALVVVLERLGVLASPRGFAIVWLLAALAFEFARVPVYFAASGALYLLPFFLGGLACQRFALEGSQAKALAAAVLAGALVWLAASPEPLNLGNHWPGLLAGLALAFLLLRSSWRSPWLAYVGSYSFAIYLLHVFFTAGSRIFFQGAGLHNVYALLLLGMVLGTLGPIVAASVIGRSALAGRWLLGSSPA